jgi:PleD family two-component response regulator
MGVSTLKARAIDSLDAVIEQADQKMYQEKRAKKLAAANQK